MSRKTVVGLGDFQAKIPPESAETDTTVLPDGVRVMSLLLPTSYELQGDTITQRVDTTRAAFPVVADPTITVGLAGATDGPGLYWNMTGTQAKVLASASATSVLGVLAVGCAAAGKVPRIGGYLKGVCGFIGAPTLSKVFSTIQRIMKSKKVEPKSCYQLKVPNGTGLKKTSKSNCA